MVLQSVVLSREHFASRASARKYVRRHNWSAGDLDANETQYRFRQREPNDFDPKTFRTKKITPGVMLILAKLKRDNPAPQGKMTSKDKTIIRHGLVLNGNIWRRP